MIERNTFFDSLKFYLIFLVILGHLLGKYKGPSVINLAVWNFIYLFHMPLFAFISGYFTKPTSLKKFKKSSFKILETFLFLHLLSLIPLIFKGTITFEKVITPWWILWYLFALVIWKVFYYTLNTKLNKRIFLFISISVALFVGFLPFIGYPLSLSRIFVFFPFFLLGTYTNEKYINKIKSIPKFTSLIFIIIVLACLVFINSSLNIIVFGSYSYYMFSNIYFGFLGRIAFFLAALSISIAFINIVPEIKIFSRTGRDTLLYYAYHGYLVLLFRKVIDYFDLNSNFILLFTLSIVILLLIYLFQKTMLSRIMLNPYSYFASKYNDNLNLKIDKKD